MAKPRLISFTPTLDTSQYGDGDLLFDCTEIPQFFPHNNGSVFLHSMRITDEDDQGAAMEVLFVKANEDLGTANSAYAISDAESRSILTRIAVASGDWFDMGGYRVAEFTSIGRTLTSVADSSSIYIAGVSRGAGTYTASGLKFLFGVV